MLHHTTAELTELPGWEQEIGECRTLADLPAAARDYLDFIVEHSGVPIGLIGVGPANKQVIWTDAGRASIAAGGAQTARI